MSNLDQISEAIGYLRADVKQLREEFRDMKKTFKEDHHPIENRIKNVETRLSSLEEFKEKGKNIVLGAVLAAGALGVAAGKYALSWVARFL